MSMPDLSEVLERLGLTEYVQVLSGKGFHNWKTVVDITEDDLTTLKFKLGHRRALQREIATFCGIHPSLPLHSDRASNAAISLSITASKALKRQRSSPSPREKRKYRRHPRADSNAPKKPKTAYVNFADQLRTKSEVSQLLFADIAKEVGRRWQDLPAEQKRVWKSNAERAMKEYKAQMIKYMDTDNWCHYQKYLNDFKAHQGQSGTTKRPSASRSTTDSSNDTRVLLRGSPSSTDSPAFTTSEIPYHIGTEAEVFHNVMTLAFSELVTLRGEVLNHSTRPYDGQYLPSQELMKRSIYAFIHGTESLVFMWTIEQADEILNRVYMPRKPVDSMTLAESTHALIDRRWRGNNAISLVTFGVEVITSE